MANDRMEQINELVKRALSEILQQELPDFFMSVTEVKTSKDLSYAKIWISAIQNEEQIVKECEKKGKEIRMQLSQKIKLKTTPYLHFVLDKTEKEAAKIDKLIEESKK